MAKRSNELVVQAVVPREANTKRTYDEFRHALETERGLVAAAARRLGVDRQTVYNAFERWPDLKTLVEDIREYQVDLVESTLWDRAAIGEPWAATLVMKTLGKSRGYVERTEVVGDPSQPLTVNVVRNVVAARPKTPDPDKETDS